MQIDLANILVHKVYFVYYVLFIISPQTRSPLLWRGRGRLLGVGFLPSLFGEGPGERFLLPSFGGVGGGFRGLEVRLSLKRGGHTDKRVNHKVNFDFD